MFLKLSVSVDNLRKQCADFAEALKNEGNRMIGWKINCVIDGKAVIAEIASQPYSRIIDGENLGFCFLVYQNQVLREVFYHSMDHVIVEERK